MATELSCVVVNYQSNDMLTRFLESFMYQETPADLVVVDLSSDQYSDKVAELVNVLEAQYWPLENIGFGRACNFASTVTNEETIAFFNADTVLFDDTLGNCTAALNLHPSWGALSPATSSTDGDMCVDGYDVKAVEEIPVSNFFIKRAVWEEITYLTQQVWPSSEGAFLPSLYGSEGAYMSRMIRHLGFDVVHYGDCLMVRDSVSRKNVSSKAIKEAKKIMEFTFEDLLI